MMHIDSSFLTGLFLTPVVCLFLVSLTRMGLFAFIGFVTAAAFYLPRFGNTFNCPKLCRFETSEVVLFNFAHLSIADANAYWLFPVLSWASFIIMMTCLVMLLTKPAKAQPAKAPAH